MKARRTLASALGAVSLAGLLALPAHAAVGTRAPEFNLPAAAGGPVRGRFRLAEHLGQRPVVVLFWATWCVPCTQELQLYQELYRRYNGQLTVVGINLDGPDSVAQAGPTARQLGLTFPIVTDLESQATNLYNQRAALPYSVWIDRTGTIVRERESFSQSERGVIETGVANMMAGRPVQ